MRNRITPSLENRDGPPHAERPPPPSDLQPANELEEELWHRRQERRDASIMQAFSMESAPLVPLVLALARLAAQRDAGISRREHP